MTTAENAVTTNAISTTNATPSIIMRRLPCATTLGRDYIAGCPTCGAKSGGKFFPRNGCIVETHEDNAIVFDLFWVDDYALTYSDTSELMRSDNAIHIARIVDESCRSWATRFDPRNTGTFDDTVTLTLPSVVWSNDSTVDHHGNKYAQLVLSFYNIVCRHWDYYAQNDGETNPNNAFVWGTASSKFLRNLIAQGIITTF